MTDMKNDPKYWLGLFLLLLAVACAPDRDDDGNLPPAPEPPELSVDRVQGDSNRFVIRDLSAGFQRLWDLPGGTPKTSGLVHDTVFYSKAGTYTITLYSAASDGGGTASATRTVVVEKDAPLECSPELSFLTGDCGPGGKCWTFSREAGAVSVGPTYGDVSWYTSPEDGLQDEQYDDDFCFTFDGLVYVNDNKGLSVNPWNGYTPEPLDPGVSEFLYLKGTGVGGRDQIVIPDDQFMGLRDADNVMDIEVLEADRLVLRMRICNQSGVPNAEGWFQLTFEPR